MMNEDMGHGPPKDQKELACTWVAVIAMFITTPWVYSFIEPDLLPFLEIQYGEKLGGWVNKLLLVLSFPALYGVYKAFTMIAATALLGWAAQSYWASRLATSAF